MKNNNENEVIIQELDEHAVDAVSGGGSICIFPFCRHKLILKKTRPMIPRTGN